MIMKNIWRSKKKQSNRLQAFYLMVKDYYIYRYILWWNLENRASKNIVNWFILGRNYNLCGMEFALFSPYTVVINSFRISHMFIWNILYEMIQREAMSTIVSPSASFVSHSILDYVILAFQLYQKTSYTYSKYTV
jgi:hypothetical protein